MQINPNDPVTPIKEGVNGHEYFGLTIRAHFAALIMQGLVANSDYEGGTNEREQAAGAARRADALIAELNKPPTPPGTSSPAPKLM